MKSKTHPLVGLMVKGYLFDHYSVGRVDAVILSGSGKKVDRTIVGLIVREHSASAAVRLPNGIDSWELGQQAYVGQRHDVDLDRVKHVWPGRDEAWVDINDYLEFLEWEPEA